MLLGHIDLVDRHVVRGWAADTDQPFEAVEVAIVVDGRPAAVVRADQERDDLKDSASLGSGRHGLVYLFEPPLPADQAHQVNVRFVKGGKPLSQWRLELGGEELVGSEDLLAAADSVLSRNDNVATDEPNRFELIGFLDLCSRERVAGWAACKQRPDERVDVAIFVDDRLVAEVHCDKPRKDLAALGFYGDGAHGFGYDFDPVLAADQDHDVVIRLIDGGMPLSQQRLPRATEQTIVSALVPVAEPAILAGERGANERNTATSSEARLLTGFLDECTQHGVSGWAACEGRPDEVIDVSVFIDGRNVAQVRCDELREDLAAAGTYGDGAHGFSYRFDPPLPSGVVKRVRVRFAHTGALLTDGERWLRPSGFDATLGITGHLDVASHEGVEGWAADPTDPEAIVDVIAYVNGQRVARVRCDKPREDLEASGEWGSGEHGFHYLFPSALSSHKEYRISVVAERTGEPLPGGRRLLLPAQEIGEPIPLLVTAPPRCGTTLLMSRLSRSPSICTAELYPFEVRLMGYYAEAYRVLTTKADLLNSTHPDRLQENLFFVGFNPFSDADYTRVFSNKDVFTDYFSGVVPSKIGTAMRELVLNYYKMLAENQGKTQIRYFLEKNVNLVEETRNFVHQVFGAVKEIVLIRDPRDMYASQMAFFKEEDRENLFFQISEACKLLVTMKQDAGPDSLFIQYEALIFDEERVLKTLSEFLGVEIPLMVDVAKDQLMFRRHATSSSSAASVARWKRDLGVDQIRHCNEKWQNFLEMFSYGDEGYCGVRDVGHDQVQRPPELSAEALSMMDAEVTASYRHPKGMESA
jgi:hypothetical protein